ncbi:hypothetical protein SUGI_0150080 [Cryptomeria japonica]|nr:hypothetical protein SUGI_0150080 [Cryptomeria japonica]
MEINFGSDRVFDLGNITIDTSDKNYASSDRKSSPNENSPMDESDTVNENSPMDESDTVNAAWQGSVQ